MKTQKINKVMAIAAMAALFSACTGVNPDKRHGHSANAFVYRGHNFGENRNSVYRQGVYDGCKTTDGDYTKKHFLFKTNEDYRSGWEHGRLHCKAVK